MRYHLQRMRTPLSTPLGGAFLHRDTIRQKPADE
jgi:hypothetical protein